MAFPGCVLNLKYMIAKLTGTIVDKDDTSIILDVRGVGYRVYTTARVIDNLDLDDSSSLWIHQVVQEKALDLYGFIDKNDLAIFELLLKLPKVGPKSAIQFLRQADAGLLKEAIINNDPGYLTKVSGLTKKTAEKIVLGLKDKLDMLPEEIGNQNHQTEEKQQLHSEIIDTLLALGYSNQVARSVINDLPPEIKTTNEAVKYALKNLQ